MPRASFNKREHLRGRCRCLHHGFRNVFGFGKRSGDVNSRRDDSAGLNVDVSTEAELIQRHSEAVGQSLNIFRRLHAHRQNNQVILL